MPVSRSTFTKMSLDAMTGIAADMTGADDVDSMMVASIAMRLAYNLTGRIMAEDILYRVMFLAQQNGHTALPSNAAKLFAIAKANDEVREMLPR